MEVFLDAAGEMIHGEDGVIIVWDNAGIKIMKLPVILQAQLVAGEILLLGENASQNVLVLMLQLKLPAVLLQDVFGNQILDGARSSKLPNVQIQLLTIIRPHVRQQVDADGKIRDIVIQMEEDFLLLAEFQEEAEEAEAEE